MAESVDRWHEIVTTDAYQEAVRQARRGPWLEMLANAGAPAGPTDDQDLQSVRWGSHRRPRTWPAWAHGWPRAAARQRRSPRRIGRRWETSCTAGSRGPRRYAHEMCCSPEGWKALRGFYAPP
jgi:hypothetical protein